MRRIASIVPSLLVAYFALDMFGCGTQHPKERKKTSMEQLVRDLKNHNNVTISVTTGTEHFRKGEVKLSVRGDGKVTIHNLMVGKHREFTGKLSADEVEALGRDFAAAGFTTLRSPGPPREAGDTPLVLEITQGGQQRYRAELWYGDRYKMRGVDTIIKRFDTIVTKMTGGELPY